MNEREVDARECFEEMSELSQARLLDRSAQVLAEMGLDDATPEEIEEVAVLCCLGILENHAARVQEFITDEVMARLVREERKRLSEEHPEGVREDWLQEAVLRRTQEEYPALFRVPKQK